MIASEDLLTRVRAEIEARREQLRPLLAEHEQLLAAAATLEAEAARGARAAPSTTARAPRGASQKAILAALEHGSHTVSELVVVTGVSAASLRESLRRLLAAGAVTRARRDGRAAYALAAPPPS